MGLLKSIWGALPLFIRAIILGVLIVEVGSTLSVVPLIGNLKFHPDIPWALPATLVVLLLYGGWLFGAGPPASTAEARRLNARAGPVSGRMWAAALPAIVFGVIMLLLLRLAAPYVLPVAAPSVKIPLDAYPLISVAGGLAAIAISAAVVEEIGFRGYMQRTLESRYGLIPALLVTGVMFWAAHLPDVTITHLPGQLLASDARARGGRSRAATSLPLPLAGVCLGGAVGPPGLGGARGDAGGPGRSGLEGHVARSPGGRQPFRLARLGVSRGGDPDRLRVRTSGARQPPRSRKRLSNLPVFARGGCGL